MSDSTLCYFPQLSSSTKDTSENASPSPKNEDKGDSDLKEEEKKETTDTPAAATEEKKVQEESKEETKQDTEVKEETSGKNKNTGKFDEIRRVQTDEAGLCGAMLHDTTNFFFSCKRRKGSGGEGKR